MENTQEQKITIETVESRKIPNGSTVYNLKTDKGRFSFFDKKKDGSLTKANEQFQKFNFGTGDTVEAVYKSEESGQNPHTGQPYMNNTIIFFKTQDDNTPTTPSEPEIPIVQVEEESTPKTEYATKEDIDAINARIDEIVNEESSELF